VFSQGVREIPGVLRVEAIGEHRIRVSVPNRQGNAGQRVYDLEEDVLSRYPDALLDVWVSEAP
jgi:hypothetical protein